METAHIDEEDENRLPNLLGQQDDAYEGGLGPAVLEWVLEQVLAGLKLGCETVQPAVRRSWSRMNEQWPLLTWFIASVLTAMLTEFSWNFASPHNTTLHVQKLSSRASITCKNASTVRARGEPQKRSRSCYYLSTSCLCNPSIKELLLLKRVGPTAPFKKQRKD